MCENAHGTTTRAQSLEAPAADTQILRPCAVEVHMDDVERHECTVNSSELAGHARDAQRSKHTCFSFAVRTPQCAHTVWGKKWCPLRLEPSSDSFQADMFEKRHAGCVPPN